MAMGAAGVWASPVWLATTDFETGPVFRETMVAATSRDTIRSKARTGKPSRQLRSTWHDAWDGPDSPGALAMPQMGMVSRPAFEHISRATEAGNLKAREMVSYFVGRGVRMIDSITSGGAVVQKFKEDFAKAASDTTSTLE